MNDGNQLLLNYEDIVKLNIFVHLISSTWLIIYVLQAEYLLAMINQTVPTMQYILFFCFYPQNCTSQNFKSTRLYSYSYFITNYQSSVLQLHAYLSAFIQT
jgi:hypothetical protein